MSSEDRSIYYQGGRTGILLIHGLGGTPLQMRYVARGLARAGYTVSCPQLAGHCSSFDELRATSWGDWSASCHQAFTALQAKCDDVIVGGLSGGSLLALNLAADNPTKILGTVVYSPPLRLDGWGLPWYAGLFSLIRHRWFADLFRFAERHPYGIKDVRVREMVIQALQSGDSSTAGQGSIPGALMMELRWLSKVVRKKLGGITKPVLIIHPRDDDRASLRNTAYLQQHLGGMVESHILDGSYHIVTMDRQRDAVVERTVAFADALAPVEAQIGIQTFKVHAAE